MSAAWKIQMRNIGLILCLAVFSFVGGMIAKPYIMYISGRHGSDAGNGMPAGGHEANSADPDTLTRWTCSMHPQIMLEEPGLCPICNMDLIPLVDTGGSDNPRALSMSTTAVKLAEIQTALVRREFVTTEIRMVGKVKYDERSVNTISAWVPGRIDRLFVDYTGTRVKKNEHLAEIYSPDLLTAQQELLEAKKRVDESTGRESEYLQKSNVRALDSVRKKLRLWGLSATQVKAIEDRGSATDQMTIYATDSGVVVKKYVKEGDYVKTGTKLFTTADISKVWVVMDAYESDLAWLHYSQEVRILTEAYPGRTFHGKIAFIHPELDERTRTVKVRVNVDNSDLRLKPGMFVHAEIYAKLAADGSVVSPDMTGKWIGTMHPEIIKDHPGDCDICGMPLVPVEEFGLVMNQSAKAPLIVPVSAVLKTGTRSIVYVQDMEKKQPVFEGREIVIGPRAGEYYIVFEGLDEGDRVVTHGNFKIDSDLQIQAKPSMMNPEGGSGATGRQHGGHASTGGKDSANKVKSTADIEKEKAEETAKKKAHDRKMKEDRRATLKTKTTPQIRTLLTPVYEEYMRLHTSLYSHDFPAAKKSFAAIGKASDAVNATDFPGDSATLWTELSAEIYNASKAGFTAPDIATARVAYEKISLAIISVEKAFGHAGEKTYFVAYCPMAFKDRGASWLQPIEEVRNPYLVAAMNMPHCGEIREKLPGAGKD